MTQHIAPAEFEPASDVNQVTRSKVIPTVVISCLFFWAGLVGYFTKAYFHDPLFNTVLSSVFVGVFVGGLVAAFFIGCGRRQ